MTTRIINTIEDASIEFVGANKVKRALPTRNLKQVDPFIFIDHMVPAAVPAGASIRIPPHPHAGFEVVSYIIEGEFFHRDSKGHDQVAHAGDINWMTSGSGIVHSEGPTEAFLKKGGNLELMQVWINLPSGKKRLDPSFRNYPSATLPIVENETSRVKVLIGEYEGKTSPVSTHTPMYYYHINVKAGNTFTLPVKNDYTAGLYVMEGKVKILADEIKAGQTVQFAPEGTQVVFKALEDVTLIAFGGEPINEKVVSYGPFVMNSFPEIQEAIANFEAGKMGELTY